MSSLARLAAALLIALPPAAQAARYTYHGQLTEGDAPAQGRYDLRVRALAGQHPGAKVSHATELPGVEVVDGRFSVEVDLPDSPAAIAWFDVAVRVPGGEYETLGAPMAVAKANSACPGAWALDGNTGVPAGSFLGLADPADTTPLELRARGSRVAAFAPAASGDFGDAPTVVLGSSSNTASAPGATVAGGGATRESANGPACPECSNAASAAFAVVSGGRANRATAHTASIGGGEENIASGEHARVGGGRTNSATGKSSTVAGGEANSTHGEVATVAGGAGNSADTAAFVGGGLLNTATVRATIAGGVSNVVTGEAGTIGGGDDNRVDAINATVAGGTDNVASGEASAVAGGERNHATGRLASIGGGQDNFAPGVSSTIPGGVLNRTLGLHSLAAGYGSCAGGDYSVALGNQAAARAGNEPADGLCVGFTSSGDADGDAGTFVFADRLGGAFRSSGDNQFVVRAAGGVGINTAPPNGSIELTIASDADNTDFASLWLRQKSATGDGFLVSVGDGTGGNNAGFYIDHFNGSAQARRLELSPSGAVTLRSNTTQGDSGVTMAAGAGSWNSLSDRRVKTAITAIDPIAILDRLLALPVTEWSYTAQGQGIRHLGPMAQDFAAAFGLGENDTTIATIDADGVALAAIQGLHARVVDENAALRERLHALEARLAALEAQRAGQ